MFSSQTDWRPRYGFTPTVGMIRSRVGGGVARLTFERPDHLNAFTAAGYEQLGEAIAAASRAPDVGCIVLTGTGRAFSAGADRSLFEESNDPEARITIERSFTALLDSLLACDTPIVAAVNGVAVGIGCTILLHCDLVLAAESARFRLPFTSLGTVPEAGSTVLLHTLSRRPDVTWAALSGEWFDSAAALAMGLVWRVVPDPELEAAAGETAAALATLDRDAVAATKRLLVAGRAALVRDAIDRELAAARGLYGREATAV